MTLEEKLESIDRKLDQLLAKKEVLRVSSWCKEKKRYARPLEDLILDTVQKKGLIPGICKIQNEGVPINGERVRIHLWQKTVKNMAKRHGITV